MLQAVKPKNARSARALAKRESQQIENPKTTLFLQYTKVSNIVNLVMTDLFSLKRPLAQKFTKKNALHPFDSVDSFEFFSQKNDTSLLLFGSHSKKRPNSLTFVRTFEHKALDMIELHIDPDTMRTLSQFKNKRKPMVGLKPLICFAGTLFDSPTSNAYTLAKSILLDFFKGPDVPSVDVEGLQYMIFISVGEERVGVDAEKPKIGVRGYLINTRKSGSRLPRVEVEEMGPRIDFRVGRVMEAEESAMKEACRRPRGIEPRAKKNIETDFVGDKIGRIHLGKQNLAELQTRKMKGLKRSRGDDDALDGATEVGEGEVEFESDAKRSRL